jgi:hypothetical protein
MMNRTAAPVTMTIIPEHSPHVTDPDQTNSPTPPNPNEAICRYFARWCKLADSRPPQDLRIARSVSPSTLPTIYKSSSSGRNRMSVARRTPNNCVPTIAVSIASRLAR